MKIPYKKIVMAGIAVMASIAGYYLWDYFNQEGYGPGFISGNGRLEATEIDISAKLAGRIENILVDEGDFVEQGQVLAIMQTWTLEAQRDEARAKYHQAVTAEQSAQAQIALRESDMQSSQAVLAQRQSELDAAQRRFARSSSLIDQGAVSVREFDDDETRMHGAQAAAASAKSQVSVALAAVNAAKADAIGAEAAVKAALATIARIEADIIDSKLVAPRSGRIQYRIAQPGEVLGAGGKVLNLVDVADVYMTFFLPEKAAGRASLGQEVRIVLDAAPEYVVPAKISFVASVAQFTPKTVETEDERQKLMFRVKAQISPELLNSYLEYVKTGLPGVVWVKLDSQTDWPEDLKPKDLP